MKLTEGKGQTTNLKLYQKNFKALSEHKIDGYLYKAVKLKWENVSTDENYPPINKILNIRKL